MRLVGLGALDKEISRQQAQRAQEAVCARGSHMGSGGDRDPYDRPRIPHGRIDSGGMGDVFFAVSHLSFFIFFWILPLFVRVTRQERPFLEDA